MGRNSRYDQENGGKTKGAKVRNFADEEEISRLNEEVREWKRKCEQLKNKNDYLVRKPPPLVLHSWHCGAQVSKCLALPQAQLVPANKGGKGKRRPSSARAATASRMQPPPPPAEVWFLSLTQHRLFCVRLSALLDPLPP